MMQFRTDFRQSYPFFLELVTLYSSLHYIKRLQKNTTTSIVDRTDEKGSHQVGKITGRKSAFSIKRFRLHNTRAKRVLFNHLFVYRHFYFPV